MGASFEIVLRNSRVTSDILALVDDRTLVRYLHEHRHARRIPRKIPEPPDRPAYSPDFNPIEWIWQHLKSHYLAGYLTKSGHELGNKVYDSIRSLLDQPETIRSICRTHSEQRPFILAMDLMEEPWWITLPLHSRRAADLASSSVLVLTSIGSHSNRRESALLERKE